MTIRQISPRDVKALLDAGSPVLLLDVRQPDEYAFCHLPGSVLIPLGDLSTRHGELEIEPGTLVVVYCHHGVRSLRGAGYLEHVGIADVASMSGGIEEWSTAVDATVPRY